MEKVLSFEDAITSLEDAVKKLESGNMSLDEAIATFESAVSLVKICNGKLEQAEKRVRILTEAADGTVTDAPFDDLTDAT